MKYLYSLFFIFLINFSFAQVYVSADESASWSGYMNIFDNSGGSQGGYLFGQPWGVPALQTIISTDDSNTFQLLPNHNAYADNVGGAQGDVAYWTNSPDGGVTPGSDGNKFMDASSYVEYAANTYPGGELTFSVNVTSFTIDSRYTVKLFIKTLDPNAGYATTLNETVTIDGVGVKTVQATPDASLIVQYGFNVVGLNANPATDWGSVVLTQQTQSSQLDVIKNLSVYPNPAVDVVNIAAAESIDQVLVFDLMGRLVKEATPGSNDFRLDVSHLNKGVYMVQLKAGDKVATTKLIK